MKAKAKIKKATPLQQALQQKKRLRTKLTRLSFKEKYNMIVAMQRRRMSLNGQRCVVWPAWED